ncbi:Voltage-dependent T-type calcium channel subunit alpha-1G [Bagarius yarrelli]|uniref:Voltage-dependent T-type calcium channel subunit alpha-1G n=1 Tax=Bagarius yarrelli TaxID=175774 RepID=A0A556TJ02_BAGYA|nr:Voltage-dependent T-type calcium channel subunit alpha-1G [Bagarius yarrelli]
MMAEDGGHISEKHTAREGDATTSLPRTFIRLNDLSGGGERGAEDEAHDGAERRESAGGQVAEEAAAAEEGEEALPYPSLAPVVFFYLKQTTRPRSWCLKMVCNPYPFMYKALYVCLTWLEGNMCSRLYTHLCRHPASTLQHPYSTCWVESVSQAAYESQLLCCSVTVSQVSIEGFSMRHLLSGTTAFTQHRKMRIIGVFYLHEYTS